MFPQVPYESYLHNYIWVILCSLYTAGEKKALFSPSNFILLWFNDTLQ